MKKYFSVIMVILLFLLASFVSQRYTEAVSGLILEYGNWSFLAYVLITIVATVVAPLTSVPLLPILVATWGPLLTIVLSVFGWTIGSVIAFWVARKFGKPLVSRFFSLEKLEKIENKIPEKNLFWWLIFLRMTVPVDVLSYALGLFSKISWRIYIPTTFFGTIPAVVIFVYFGGLSFEIQLGVFLIVAVILLFVFFVFKKK